MRASFISHRHPFFWAFGRNAVLDEDWDDLFAPPVTYANCFEQYEGIGRNKFGVPIVERYVPRPVVVAPVYKPVAPAVIAALDRDGKDSG
jgi:hypothetical protein